MATILSRALLHWAPACTLALCMAATPASAQRQVERELGSNIATPKKADIPETRDPVVRARIWTADFARCVIDRSPKGVERALAMPQNGAYNHALDMLATDACMNEGQASIPLKVMRGAIFTELYRRYDRGLSPKIPVPVLDFTHALEITDPNERAALALMVFGDCVVKRDPAVARSVVLAGTASNEQDNSFRALMPNLGPCLMQGQQIAFSKPILEGVLAEVLYRQAVSPMPAATGGQ